MLTKLKNEPALVVAAVVALIGVGSAFGLQVSHDQQAAIVALVGAVLALVGGGVTRSVVTPAAKAQTAVQLAAVTPHPASLDPEAASPIVQSWQSLATVRSDVGQSEPPADAPLDDATVTADPTPDPVPSPEPEPEPPAPVEDPVKAQLKAAIESVRANSNALNDARAQAAKAAVDASS